MEFSSAFTWIIVLAVAAAFGFVCAKIAAGKGRSPVGYGLLGFFLPIVGLIVIAVLPSRTAVGPSPK